LARVAGPVFAADAVDDALLDVHYEQRG